MRVRSLYGCCIKVLVNNPRYINLTIVPNDIAEKFIIDAYKIKKSATKVVITRPWGLLLAAKQFPDMAIGKVSYNSSLNSRLRIQSYPNDLIIRLDLTRNIDSIYYQLVYNVSDKYKSSRGIEIFREDDIKNILSNIHHDGVDDEFDYVVVLYENMPKDMFDYGCKNRLFAVEYANIHEDD